MSATPLRKLAKVIRSKNSGPFEITFDIIFDNDEAYERVKASGTLNATALARAYGVTPDDVVACMFFDPAKAFKFTIRRNWAQGSIGERDTFGAQQHVLFMDIMIA